MHNFQGSFFKMDIRKRKTFDNPRTIKSLTTKCPVNTCSRPNYSCRFLIRIKFIIRLTNFFLPLTVPFVRDRVSCNRSDRFCVVEFRRFFRSISVDKLQSFVSSKQRDGLSCFKFNVGFISSSKFCLSFHLSSFFFYRCTFHAMLL